MRTIAVAIILAAVIIVVGLRPRGAAPVAPDGRPLPDVVWTDDEPYCPHCRTDVNWYASVCYTCSREFVWVPRKSPCEFCVDAARLRRFAKGLADREELRGALAAALDGYGLPPDVVAACVPDLLLYVESMKEGACGFCAGTGRRLAPATLAALAEEGDVLFEYAAEQLGEKCPVCLGTGKCIACGGDRTIEHGREDASLAMQGLFHSLSELEPDMSRAYAETWFRLVKEFLERFSGSAELSDLSSLYSSAHDQMEWSRVRLETVLDALPEGD